MRLVALSVLLLAAGAGAGMLLTPAPPGAAAPPDVLAAHGFALVPPRARHPGERLVLGADGSIPTAALQPVHADLRAQRVHLGIVISER